MPLKGSYMSKAVKKSASKGRISSEELDEKFDAGEDVLEHFDLEKATKIVNVEFPLWMVKALDAEADRLGIPRQAIIKTWLDEKLREVSRDRKAAG